MEEITDKQLTFLIELQESRSNDRRRSEYQRELDAEILFALRELRQRRRQIPVEGTVA